MVNQKPTHLDISNTDTLFQSEVMSSFKFDKAVASVFDDMVSRSVPIYAEIHQVILDLVSKREWMSGDKIVDIGCSTGTTLFMLQHHFKHTAGATPKLIGLDPSEDMLERARAKAASYTDSCVSFTRATASELAEVDVDIALMNYTLQFIPKSERVSVLKKIYQSLKPGGLFILAEKVMSPTSEVQEVITDLYYDFKRRNGYNELEISRKREALENVLVPLSQEEQTEMLKESGFHKSEMIFRWYNFACYVGIK